MKLHSIKKKTLTFVLAMSLCAGGSFTVLAAEESAAEVQEEQEPVGMAEEPAPAPVVEEPASAPATEEPAPTAVQAAGEEDSAVTGEDDVDTSLPEEIKEGSAQIAEQITGGTNTAGQEVFKNDAPASEENKDSRNAIQKAVDVALKSAKEKAGITDITIVVDDGEYDGDINISWGSDKTPGLFKTLYILAKNSFKEPSVGDVIDKSTINSGAGGGVKVNGNIIIDGINVVLSGLYYSLNTTITSKKATTTVYGTAKDDNIQVELEDSSLEVISGDGQDNIRVKGKGGENQKVDLDGGGGSDVYTVDVSTGTTVNINDQDGGRIHLTGDLKKNSNPTGNYDSAKQEASFTLTNSAGKLLKIFTKGITAFTDELTNKKQIEIKKSDLKSGIYDAGNISFSDFVYNPQNDEAVSLIIKGKGFMDSLIVSSKNLMIQKIQAAEMNVRLKGQVITVKDSIEAVNVMIEAGDDDTLVSTDNPLPGSISDKISLGDEMDASVMDIVTNAKIILEKGSNIKAGGSVVMKAVSSQKNNLVPFVEGANIINVKIGNAVISILGNIEAGGAVEATASSTVNVAASNETLAKYYIPLAAGILVSEARVETGKDSVITAGGDVKLSSISDVTLTTLSTVGALPISLALSVVVNDSHVQVLGKIISGNGNIGLNAKGSSTVTTKSTNKTPETSGSAVNPKSGSSTPTGSGSLSNKYGGFFAASVVIQDVDASLTGNGSLSAVNGNITINSQSSEKVDTQAVSVGGSKEQNSQESQTVGGVKDKITALLKGVTTKLSANAEETKNSAIGKLNSALGRIEGSSGNTITSQENEHGTVSAPSRAEVGQKVTVKAVPNTGYKLKGLTYTYLPAGSSSYVTKTVDISSGTYTFEMPASEVILVAVFEKDEQSGSENTNVGDLFDEDDDDDLGLGDLFDEGTGGAREDTPTSAQPTRIGQFDIKNYEKKSLTGKLEGAILSDHVKANTGDTIKLTVNPAEGMKLKDGSLKAIYTNAAGKKITYTVPKNSAGAYIFTMPELKVGTVLEFKADFEKGTADTTGKGSTSSSQATGALAINIVFNRNDAFIDTDGDVTAGGELSVTATADTYAHSNADGSNFDESSAGQITPTNPATGETEDNDGEITGEQRHGNVRIAATTNGTISFKSNNQTPQSGDKVAVAVTAREGYKLTDSSLVFTYQKVMKDAQGNVITDNKGNPRMTSETGSLSYDGKTGNYYFTIPEDMAEGTRTGNQSSF